MKTDRKKGGGVSINALALRCSPAVIKANPGLFGENAHTSAEHAPKPTPPLHDADGLVLELQGYAPKGINSLKGRHWSAMAKAKREAKTALARALVANGIMFPPKAAKDSRWHLYIVRYGHGFLDSGNLAGAYKQIEDAIVDAGLIPGDDWLHCRTFYDQVKAKRGIPTKTVITFMLFTGPDVAFRYRHEQPRI